VDEECEGQLMLAELTFGILVWVVIVIIITIVGSNLFAIMVDEQTRYLRLIFFYAPLPATASIASNPEPVRGYVSWALGENPKPVDCAHVRYTGRMRYGHTGRWMEMNGEALFSLAAPGFVWHAKIAYAPGIGIEALDYYVHHEAGMTFSLFSLLPLDTANSDEIRSSSLFQYLAFTPLFPMIYRSSGFIGWETVDELTAKAIIRDMDRSVEAIARFNGQGRIESIGTYPKTYPEIARPVPGLFANRFSGYADVAGYRIPMQIASEQILPHGEYVCAEYSITDVVYNISDTVKGRAA
jgi:hypothetical protein